MSDNAPAFTPEEKAVINILTYGSVAARHEIYVKLIYLDKGDALQRIYDAMNDADYYKYVVLC